jgi:glycosyltransferase involved in cell wall biosynthesis
MRVLHLVKTAVGAGWVYQQVRVLRDLGVDALVVLPRHATGLGPAYRQAGVTVIECDLDFPTHAPWLLPARLNTCRELVRGLRPDVIHTHHVGTTLVVRLALGKHSRIPRIFQVPGPLHLEHNFFANVERATAGPADSWIATCQWTLQRYRALGVSRDRVFLSYAGTDITAFDRTASGQLRRELGIPVSTPLAGMVCYIYAPKRYLGQTRGLKGHEDFFEAVRLVRKVCPSLRAVVIGGAWRGAQEYERQLHREAARLCGDSLVFLGTRSDVPQLYRDLDLAVVPSHSENCGGAVEPLLCGVPVVATSVGGLPDLITPGETGWLVPKRDPASLARAMSEALQNRAESLRRAVAGRELARKLFDVRRTAEQVSHIYEAVLAHGSSNVPAPKETIAAARSGAQAVAPAVTSRS